jgi:hypothetical protein
MTPLLGPDAFPGEWIGAEGARASWVGEAWFDGVLVWTAIRRDVLDRVLPTGWQPAHNLSPHGELHPLVVVLGRQRHTSILFGGLPLPSDAEYDEVMLAVPFVWHVRHRRLHTFIPRMYSQDPRATWSGNAQYGFGKRMGRIERLGGLSVAVDEHDRCVLHCSARPVTSWTRSNDEQQGSLAGVVSAMSRLPIVGVRYDGSEVESYFAWGLAGAWTRRAHARLTVHRALAAGLDEASVSADAALALDLRDMRWRLSWPQPSRAGAADPAARV